jgi:hypothetical protein
MIQQGKQMRVSALKGLPYHSVKLVLMANGNRYEVDSSTFFLTRHSPLSIENIVLSQVWTFLTWIFISVVRALQWKKSSTLFVLSESSMFWRCPGSCFFVIVVVFNLLYMYCFVTASCSEHLTTCFMASHVHLWVFFASWFYFDWLRFLCSSLFRLASCLNPKWTRCGFWGNILLNGWTAGRRCGNECSSLQITCVRDGLTWFDVWRLFYSLAEQSFRRVMRGRIDW